ncbi:MAG: DUF1289 domain-containing protein [Alphaproteobacteria bacterium]|nr:DUF1289 domain-containing protein [Alphaproteobacteria bacterium]
MVDSPCKKKCQLNQARSHCISCKRSLKEIASWSQMSDEYKHQIVSELPQRNIAN